MTRSWAKNGSLHLALARADDERVLVIGVFPKATPKTPRRVIDLYKRRLKEYDARQGEGV